mmetsp:Transcript_27791/g.64087  ORF Transcript_27791/g.64087 Transcript_27791/m.64087 type:complete len:239 (-) Transcript_27791:16-732(-)
MRRCAESGQRCCGGRWKCTGWGRAHSMHAGRRSASWSRRRTRSSWSRASGGTSSTRPGSHNGPTSPPPRPPRLPQDPSTTLGSSTRGVSQLRACHVARTTRVWRVTSGTSCTTSMAAGLLSRAKPSPSTPLAIRRASVARTEKNSGTRRHPPHLLPLRKLRPPPRLPQHRTAIGHLAISLLSCNLRLSSFRSQLLLSMGLSRMSLPNLSSDDWSSSSVTRTFSPHPHCEVTCTRFGVT